MSELRFDGRTAIVTGAGRGLGRAHALLLASRGANVVVNDPGVELGGEGGDAKPAEAVVREITEGGGRAVANFGHVDREADAEAMVAQAVETFGSIDIVVNNAGVFVLDRSFEETTTESFSRLFQVHLLGAVNVTRAAWPHFKRAGYGRVVNTASHSGYLGAPENVEYAAAKMAVHGLTRALSFEASRHGIGVNAIAPGALTRPVSVRYPDFPPSPGFAPDLVSPTVAWLAHEDCPVNGMSFGCIAGSTTRIVVAETRGITSAQPTPEFVRDNFSRVLDEAAVDGSGLDVRFNSVVRGAEFVERFERARAGSPPPS